MSIKQTFWSIIHYNLAEVFKKQRQYYLYNIMIVTFRAWNLLPNNDYYEAVVLKEY